MDNNVNNFIVPLRLIKNSILKTYVGVIKVRGEGTVKWKTEEDDGKIHFIIILKVNYIPEDTICLLLHHMWSQ